ncbi:MAG TPA: hypothetical protein VGM07_23235 [Stellaceae bacterium]|jgi:hypothetical protein
MARDWLAVLSTETKAGPDTGLPTASVAIVIDHADHSTDCRAAHREMLFGLVDRVARLPGIGDVPSFWNIHPRLAIAYRLMLPPLAGRRRKHPGRAGNSAAGAPERAADDRADWTGACRASRGPGRLAGYRAGYRV